jgi:hypothetical protein
VEAQERAARAAKEAASVPPPIQARATTTTKPAPSAARVERDRQALVAAHEAQIAEAEAALSRCTAELQAASDNERFADLGPLSEQYAATQAQLERLMAEWETVAG